MTQLARELDEDAFGWHGTVHRVPSARGIDDDLVVVEAAPRSEGPARIRTIVEIAGPGERAPALDHAPLLMQISAPGLVRVHEVVVRRSGTFLVTDHVDGESLAQLLDEAARRPPNERAIPVPIALRIVLDVLEGLQALHAVYGRAVPRRIHGRLCPSAVLVGADGRARIADLGGLRVEDHGGPPERGELGYLAPEQWLGDDVDERTDVFAVGVLLWELLSGQRLFAGPRDDVLFAVTHARVPALPKTSRLASELHFLCLRALAPSRDARIATASAFARAIADLVATGKIDCTRDRVSEYLESRLGDELMIRRSYLRIVSSAPPPPPSTPPTLPALVGADFDDEDATRPVCALWAMTRDRAVERPTEPAPAPVASPPPATRHVSPPVDERPVPRPAATPRRSPLSLALLLVVVAIGALLGFYGEHLWTKLAQVTTGAPP